MLFVSSWDDGHPLDERLAEMLSRHGMRGTFFVPMQNAEGLSVISAPALRRLGAAHEIGSHTRDHVYLRGLPPAVMQEQVSSGKTALEDVLGQRVHGFCYPGGRFDARVTSIVRDAGFDYARTVENLRIDLGKNLFEVATTLQFFPHKLRTLARNLMKYPRPLYKLSLLRRLRSGGGLADHLRIAAAYAQQRDGILHVWGHSWEIDRYELWNDLERFLHWLADLRPTSISLQQLADRYGGVRG